MSETDIICKPTPDTFVRFGVVIAALLGFACYFFYDGAVGYRLENEQIACYRGFAELGEASLRATSGGWKSELSQRPLILNTIRRAEDPSFLAFEDAAGHVYPLPADCEAAATCPPEVQDLPAMQAGWSECWAAYTRRRHFPIKPAEHPHDEAAIREQWYAGAVFTVLGLALLGLALRTKGRVMALRGDRVTVAGETFAIEDIESLDLRQWGPGFKGAAYLRVKGRKLKADGMTYGGFSAKNGEPAERWMKGLLARYKGEIIEYETPQKS